MNNNKDTRNVIEIIKNEWRAIFAALQFLTIIPSLNRRLYSTQELGKSVGYYPLIGAFIGLSLLLVDRLLSFLFPVSVASVLLIAFWVAVSGGLHFDGFLDSCDGILGGMNPEDRLNIMKDERVGAFGLLCGILLIVLKISAVNSIDIYRDQAFLLAPLISRWGMSIAVVSFPYAREVGLGKDIKDHAKTREAIIATLFMFFIGIVISRVSGLVIMIVAILFILGIARFITSNIPGLTGDCYGATNEMSEVLVLLTFLVMAKFQ